MPDGVRWAILTVCPVGLFILAGPIALVGVLVLMAFMWWSDPRRHRGR